MSAKHKFRCSMCLEKLRYAHSVVAHEDVGGWRPVTQDDLFRFSPASVAMTTLWPYKQESEDDSVDCCMDGALMVNGQNAYVV